MTPKEAVDRLRQDRWDTEGWAELQALLVRLAEKTTREPALREAAVDAVRTKIEEQLEDNDLEAIDNPPAYFARALRWRVFDALRRRKSAARGAEKLRAAEAQRIAEEAAAPPPIAGVLATLEKVVERAISRRDPWQREHLEHAWVQMRALHVEGLSLREIVAREGAVDPDEVERAVQRAHKSHQRARVAFLDALDGLEKLGRIDPDSAADARAAISRLKRRQDRAATRVSAPGGSP